MRSMSKDPRLDQLPLGKPTDYVSTYTPSLLRSVPRAPLREPLGIEAEALPFHGADLWNGYELSWLNRRGKPELAVLRLQVPASTPCIIESKSLKLYLNSFSQTNFASRAEVSRTLESDLTLAARAPVSVRLVTLDQVQADGFGHFAGTSLDTLDVDVTEYRAQPSLLQTDREVNVRESVFTHLLRSLCPVTGQPDWGSLQVQYTGPAIDHASLLRYVVSLREHRGFHEETVERIFMDLQRRCRPSSLTVYACYLRRGGLDINPYRSTEPGDPPMIRLGRQ
jgi:7-cyano-7-deazaguanine reductase